jgi:hypothetical protein
LSNLGEAPDNGVVEFGVGEVRCGFLFLDPLLRVPSHIQVGHDPQCRLAVSAHEVGLTERSVTQRLGAAMVALMLDGVHYRFGGFLFTADCLRFTM